MLSALSNVGIYFTVTGRIQGALPLLSNDVMTVRVDLQYDVDSELSQVMVERDKCKHLDQILSHLGGSWYVTLSYLY
jgi:hypothetical protein